MGVTNHLPTRMIIFRPCLNGNDPPFIMIRLGWHFLVLPKWDDSPSSLGNVKLPHWLDLFFQGNKNTKRERANPAVGTESPILSKGAEPQHAWGLQPHWGGKCRLFHEFLELPYESLEERWKGRTLEKSSKSQDQPGVLAPKSSQSHCANGSQQKSLGPLPTEISELPCLAELQFFFRLERSVTNPCAAQRTVETRQWNWPYLSSFRNLACGLCGPPQQTNRCLYLTKNHIVANDSRTRMTFFFSYTRQLLWRMGIHYLQLASRNSMISSRYSQEITTQSLELQKWRWYDVPRSPSLSIWDVYNP